MFCKNCGHQVPDTAQFCPNCGVRVEPVIYAAESTEQAARDPFEQAKEEPSENKRKRSFGKAKSILSSLGTILLIILIIVGNSKHPVADTKNIVFDDIGTIGVGNAAERSIAHPKWSADRVEKNHYLVTVSGFMKDIGGNFSMTFDVNYVDDSVYAKPKYAAYDGEIFDDWFSLTIALGLLYG